jgi:hypothetical protein
VATDEPTPPAPSPISVPASPQRRRGGRLLFILAGVLAAVLLIGGGAAFVVYDKATEIDRSTPEVVADQFLDAGLVLRDVRRMSLFVCPSWSAGAAMATVAAPTDPKVIVSWGDVTSSTRGGTSVVSVSVQFSIAVSGGYQQSVQNWRLDLADDDGWRVCGLTKG